MNNRGLGQEEHVVQHAEALGSLTLSRRPRNAARTLPKTTNGSRALKPASVLPAPGTPVKKQISLTMITLGACNHIVDVK